MKITGAETYNTKFTKRQYATNVKDVDASAWSDLPLDLLGEIKKRVFGPDHIRFSCVCKSWQAAQHDKRPVDALPWFLVLDLENASKISYKLYEFSTRHLAPVYSYSIDLHQFFDVSRLECSTYNTTHLNRCLLISMFDKEGTCTYFLLFSLATKRVITLPQLDHRLVFPVSDRRQFTAVSTNPTSPDCVFLALCFDDTRIWTIGTFRHGDIEWTTTKYAGVGFGIPYVDDAVFIGGVFYFLCRPSGLLASYDIATREFKADPSSAELSFWTVQNKLFGLDGKLMLTYHEIQAHKYVIKSYDWSQKVWVPLNSLGNRSLYISKRSVYVDTINYYGASANKIYVKIYGECRAYSLENGKLSRCTLSGLGYFDAVDLPCTSETFIWVEPPDLLP